MNLPFGNRLKVSGDKGFEGFGPRAPGASAAGGAHPLAGAAAGLVGGAGGIGGALFAAFQRFDYDCVCAMLLSIILLIFAGEIIANKVRAVFLERTRVDEE